MISEGAIDIGLDLAHGVVQGVRVSSTRPSNAGRALVGREPHDALALVPLLFPVCGMAQAVACGRAIAEAQGARDDDRARGTAIALAEAIASHLFQLASVWREAASAAPDFDAVRGVRARVTQLARAVGVDRAAAATLADPCVPFTVEVRDA